MSEKALQTKITRYLRDKGAYVIKTTAAPGIPTGCPDIIALYNDRWLAIEVKASISAHVRPVQVHTLNYLLTHSVFVYRAYPENWDTVRIELETKFFPPTR